MEQDAVGGKQVDTCPEGQNSHDSDDVTSFGHFFSILERLNENFFLLQFTIRFIKDSSL